MFLYEFAEKTAQKPDTVATYVRRNKKIFKNHVERRQKQIWLDEKAVDILLKKYPEVQKKQKKPLNKEKFEEIITKSLKTLYENQEILAKEFLFCRTRKSHFSDSKDVSTCENNKRHVGDSHKLRKHDGLRLFLVTFFRKKASNLFVRQTTNRACWDTPKP